MYATNYLRPKSLAEAASMFADAGDAAYVSGGHTLLPAMKGRLAAPANLIDLRHLPELKGVSADAGRVTIGAGTSHAEVAANPTVKAHLPVLAGLAGSIGDIHVRHMGTIGGSVANNDPAADYPSALLALDAIVTTDRRDIPVADYLAGLYTTTLEEGEIVTKVSFAVPQSCGYAKFRNPASRYAMAASFVARFADGVRIGITGCGDEGAFRWNEAEAALSARFAEDAIDGLALDPGRMMGDIHGSSEYRAHLAKVMTRRAVTNQGMVLIQP
ncbi:carbon-monoxide dehydrogenase medium subunit [Devosia enhydra]|uniref:Carbon-monoxide dehydrogenase medium subunit n=1 Tax=Devosia enhydra TaxID=665118 RepID=A0A1K2HWC6_9HYPH|nr:xanthine dehydrogenase family protein subunit M [Devosia enhydra]SFZ83311.1 carbon-monoxide dehydrogenase medium subunit [Devosia enhydra]